MFALERGDDHVEMVKTFLNLPIEARALGGQFQLVMLATKQLEARRFLQKADRF